MLVNVTHHGYKSPLSIPPPVSSLMRLKRVAHLQTAPYLPLLLPLNLLEHFDSCRLYARDGWRMLGVSCLAPGI